MTIAQENRDVVNAALQKAKKPGTLSGLKHTQVQDVLNGMKSQIAQALPKHLTADRMIQMACTLITKNPKLGECSVGSLIGAVMQASILGFRPVEATGECYFVPYGGQVQFQIGYKGYISLGRRTGELKTIYAECVYEGDYFEVEYGLEPKLIHRPNIDNDGKKITHVYAVARYKDDGYNFVVLTLNKVHKLRKRNPMQKETPVGAWATDFEAMAKAKAIKQLSKYMPLSVDFMDAVVSDEAVISEKAFTNDQSGLKIEAFTYDPEPPEEQVEDVQIINEEPSGVTEDPNPGPQTDPNPESPEDPNHPTKKGPAHTKDVKAPPIILPKKPDAKYDKAPEIF